MKKKNPIFIVPNTTGIEICSLVWMGKKEGVYSHVLPIVAWRVEVLDEFPEESWATPISVESQAANERRLLVVSSTMSGAPRFVWPELQTWDTLDEAEQDFKNTMEVLKDGEEG